jgi:hypothetical protein
MPQFFVSYHGGRPFKTDAEAKANQARWTAWMNGLGGAVVNFGTPLAPGKAVSAAGVADDNPDERLTGYSIVDASGLEAALAMVKDCPFLEIGTVKVAELRSMGA